MTIDLRPASPLGRKLVNYDIQDNVAVIRFDTPNSKVNVLSEALTREFVDVFQEVSGNKDVGSIVLISSKPGCFIAGADISAIEDSAFAPARTFKSKNNIDSTPSTTQTFDTSVNGPYTSTPIKEGKNDRHRVVGTRLKLLEKRLEESYDVEDNCIKVLEAQDAEKRRNELVKEANRKKTEKNKRKKEMEDICLKGKR
eukprot:gene7608-13418_t